MVMNNYSWVAGDTTDAVGDVGQQIGDRPAEVVVPRGLTLELVEVMKRGPLRRGTVSFLGRSHRTENHISSWTKLTSHPHASHTNKMNFLFSLLGKMNFQFMIMNTVNATYMHMRWWQLSVKF
jgi:hypothetical protein